MSGSNLLIRGHPKMDAFRCLSFKLIRISRPPIFEVATNYEDSAPRLRTHILDIASSHLTNPAFEITILEARNLGVTFCPLKSICSNPMRRKLLKYFPRELHRHTYSSMDTCQLGIAPSRYSSTLEICPRSSACHLFGIILSYIPSRRI